MSSVLNWSFIILFALLAGMQGGRFLKVKKYIKFYEKQWNGIRICFAVISVFVIVGTFTQTITIMEILRSAVMLAACIAYIVCRDGVGDEGVVVNGTLKPWKEIQGWNVVVNKKNAFGTFQLSSEGMRKPEKGNFLELQFDAETGKKLEDYLNQTQKRKYRRIKR